MRHRHGIRGALHAVVVTALLVASVVAPSPASAATDTTISVGSDAIGNFGADMLGSNLTPWGGFWPNNRSATALHDAGLGLLRVGHGEKVYVDMEAWYPAHGQWNWNAGGSFPGTSHSFNEQIAWWKSLGIPVLYTLNDELSTAMLNQNGTLNYAEIAYAWAGHIKYLVDQGVNVKYVEIGNECDIAPGEGIQYPPVDFSGGSDQLSGSKYVDLHIGEPAYANGSNEYIKLWEAVVPAIKAAVPGIKVSAYPSGQGTVTSLSFPFDYLFESATSKPDFFPVHVYSFAAWGFVPSPQRLLDSTWQYSGRFVDWSNEVGTVAETLQGYGAPASLPIGITEWNYDGATVYEPGTGSWGASEANAMWDAVFAASVLTNASNGGMDLTTFWETFPGSNTDELFDDDYATTTPRSQALAYRLLSQFAGGVVRATTVTSSDNAVPYDWQNVAVSPASVGGKRVECLATTDASGYRLLIINKNVTTAHSATVQLAGLDEGSATIKTYTTRTSLAQNAPVAGNAAVSGGSFGVVLPPMSLSVVTVSGEVGPPPDQLAKSFTKLAASSPVVDWAGKAVVSGTLRDGMGGPIEGAMRVYRSFDRSSWAFCATATVGASGVPGTFTYSDPRVVTRKVYYRARFMGNTEYDLSEANASVTPRVKFSTPAAPSSIASGARARVSGWVYPRHAARSRSVKVIAWRKEGTRWVARASAWATTWDGTGGRTNYAVYLRLSGRGTWKVAAYHPYEGLHANTYSAPRYLRVR